MNKRKATNIGVIWCCALLALMLPPAATAELTEHHGYRVNPEGSVRDCLSCHDGAMVGTVSYCTVKCDFSTAHSVLKRYPPGKDRDAYASLESVSARGVRIVKRRVVCISCHNLRNPNRYHLVLDDQEALCGICHLKPNFRQKNVTGGSSGADPGRRD